MNDDTFDPQLFGARLTSQAESTARMYAMITASENGLFDLTDEMIDEVIGEGPEATKALVYSLMGSFRGLLTLLCGLTDADPDSFVSKLATGNSRNLEVGREILRQCELGS